jgi:folate-dependent phosphoribosylglycinamide formyltransferase PurN
MWKSQGWMIILSRDILNSLLKSIANGSPSTIFKPKGFITNEEERQKLEG